MKEKLEDEYLTTELGTYKISVRNGKTMVVFLNGWVYYDTAQIFDPIIQKIPSDVGILAVDYLDSGLSSPSMRTFTFAEEADQITKIIHDRAPEKVILVAHSLGGIYALYVARKLGHLEGFVGIEPTTREVIVDPPNEPGYIEATKSEENSTQAEIVERMKKRVYDSFSKKAADQIQETALQAAAANSAGEEIHGLDLSEKTLEDEEYLSLGFPPQMPAILFCHAYRVKEFERSEYHTEGTSVRALGSSHYLHFEYPDQISDAINELLNKLR